MHATYVLLLGKSLKKLFEEVYRPAAVAAAAGFSSGTGVSYSGLCYCCWLCLPEWL
jgi:hypothetical protein